MHAPPFLNHWEDFTRLHPFGRTRVSTSVLQDVSGDQPTASLFVWAYVVPLDVIIYAVLLGRGSWMRFTKRTYRVLPPCLSDNCVFGDVTLSHVAPSGGPAFATNTIVTGGACHLRFAGCSSVLLAPEPQMININLVRSMGMPALMGHYLVDVNSHGGIFTLPEVIVPNGKQLIPFRWWGETMPVDMIRVTSAPFRRSMRITAHTDSLAPVVDPVPPPNLPHEHMPTQSDYCGGLSTWGTDR